MLTWGCGMPGSGPVAPAGRSCRGEEAAGCVGALWRVLGAPSTSDGSSAFATGDVSTSSGSRVKTPLAWSNAIEPLRLIYSPMLHFTTSNPKSLECAIACATFPPGFALSHVLTLNSCVAGLGCG